MTKYVLKRIGLAIVTAFIILSLTFIFMKMLPIPQPAGLRGQVFAFYEQQAALGYVIHSNSPLEGFGPALWSDTDPKSAINHFYYARPVMEQYGLWIKNIVTEWDWGTSTSIDTNVSAIKIIGERIVYSLQVNIISVFVSVPIGISLGILAALKKNKLTDHFISTAVMVFISIPSFVVISLLMLWFCFQNEWLPIAWPAENAAPGVKAAGFVIPVLSLSFGSICGYTRFTRAELCEVMSSEYLLLARTKGLTKSQSIIRHALRNAMVPIVPSIIAEFISVLGGSMILEQLYGIPGIGNLFIEAINLKDYNVLMVDMAIFTMISLFASVLLDLSYGFIDPRIRMGAKK